MTRTELDRRIVQNHEMMAALGSQRARLQAEMDTTPDPLTAPIAASLQRSTMRLVERGLVAVPVEDGPALTAPSRAAARSNRPAADDLDDPGDANSPAGPAAMEDDLARMDLPDLLELRQEIRADNLPPDQRAHMLHRVGIAIADAERELNDFEEFKRTQAKAGEQKPSLTRSEYEPVDELDADYGLGDELVPDPIPWGDANAMAELSW